MKILINRFSFKDGKIFLNKKKMMNVMIFNIFYKTKINYIKKSFEFYKLLFFLLCFLIIDVFIT